MKRAVVIGLGMFGFNVAKVLYQSGFEVVAIDKNKDMVQRIKDYATKVIVADATDKDMMNAVRIQEDDVVVISFGENLAATALITLYFKELKAKRIIVKAPNEDYKHVLEKVGASEVIIPEKEMAERVAKSLISPNVLDYIPLSGDYTICEMMPPPEFCGKSIGQLNLRPKYHVDVIAVKEGDTDRVMMVPNADFVIKNTDILILLGKEQDLHKVHGKAE